MSPPEAPRDALELLAEHAVATVLGEPAPAGADPATTRRLAAVVDAIVAADRRGREVQDPEPGSAPGRP